uniref:Uncharacterized protein n=1 Tax=Anopheles atroparvus TaxID=41427 RepID=A0A182IWD8_ANOAO
MGVTMPTRCRVASYQMLLRMWPSSCARCSPIRRSTSGSSWSDLICCICSIESVVSFTRTSLARLMAACCVVKRLARNSVPPIAATMIAKPTSALGPMIHQSAASVTPMINGPDHIMCRSCISFTKVAVSLVSVELDTCGGTSRSMLSCPRRGVTPGIFGTERSADAADECAPLVPPPSMPPPLPLAPPSGVVPPSPPSALSRCQWSFQLLLDRVLLTLGGLVPSRTHAADHFRFVAGTARRHAGSTSQYLVCCQRAKVQMVVVCVLFLRLAPVLPAAAAVVAVLLRPVASAVLPPVRLSLLALVVFVRIRALLHVGPVEAGVRVGRLASLWIGLLFSPNELCDWDEYWCIGFTWCRAFFGVSPGPNTPANSSCGEWSGSCDINSDTGVKCCGVSGAGGGAMLKPFISLRSFWRFFFPPTPLPAPVAMAVFIPLFFRISTSSQRNAEMSCLISFTSSSVTPCDSAFRCSTVTYRRTRLRMMLWYRKSRSLACLTFR